MRPQTAFLKASGKTNKVVRTECLLKFRKRAQRETEAMALATEFSFDFTAM